MGYFDLKNLKKLQGPSCNTVEIDTSEEQGKPATYKNKPVKPQ